MAELFCVFLRVAEGVAELFYVFSRLKISRIGTFDENCRIFTQKTSRIGMSAGICRIFTCPRGGGALKTRIFTCPREAAD